MDAFLTPHNKTSLDCWYRIHPTRSSNFQNDKDILTVIPESFDDNEEQKELQLYDPPHEEGESYGVPRYYGIHKYGHPQNHNCFEGVEEWESSAEFVGDLDAVRLQPDVVNKVLQKCEEAVDRSRVCGGILCLPPGYGKTVISLKIASDLHLKTLFIVHRQKLCDQICERAQQFIPNVTVGRIQQNVRTDGDIVVASIQTLVNRIDDNMRDFMKKFGLVFIDEAHHIGARTFSQVFRVLPCPFIFGLSATPTRTDGLTRVLHWFLGPTLFSVDQVTQLQISKSRDLDISVYRLKVEYKSSKSRLSATNGFSRQALMTCYRRLTWNKRRNKMIDKWIQLNFNPSIDKCLVLSKRIDHLYNIQKFLPSTYNSKLCTSRQSKKDRIKAFEADIILSTYEMCNEGVDLPTITMLILAMPAGNTEQVVGRLERGKGKKVILDVWDTGIQSLLDGMAQKRLRVYQQKEWMVYFQKVTL